MSKLKRHSKHRRAQGTGSVYQRPGCKTWEIQYFLNGRRVRESTGKRTQQEAADVLAIRLGAIAKGEPVAATRGVKVQALWDRLLEYNKVNGKKTQLHHWRVLGPSFSNLPAVKVDSRLLAQYRSMRQGTLWRGKPITPRTVNREFTTLRRMYNVAMRHTTPPLVAAIPTFDMAKEAKPRSGFVDALEYTKMKQAAEFRGEMWLITMVELAYRYGWRTGELVPLKVRNCNFNTRTITLDPGTTKNEDGREVVMTARVQQLLERCCKGKKPEQQVLTREDGGPVVTPRVGWNTLCVSVGLGHWQCLSCKAISNVRGRCGQCGAYHWAYRGLNPHDMRRSAVRAMMRAGIDPHKAMAMTGHKTASMLARYHIIDHTAHVDAVAKMERVAAAEEKAARAQLARKPQSSHNVQSAVVAATKPQSSQVQ